MRPLCFLKTSKQIFKGQLASRISSHKDGESLTTLTIADTDGIIDNPVDQSAQLAAGEKLAMQKKKRLKILPCVL